MLVVRKLGFALRIFAVVKDRWWVFLCPLQLLSLLLYAVRFVTLLDFRLELSDAPIIEINTELVSRSCNNPRRQIHLQSDIVPNFKAVGLCVNNWLRYFLTVSLVSSIVFDLNVQVEAALAGIRLGALCIGAAELAFDLVSASPIMLFATWQVPLSGGPFKIFIAVIKLLDLENAFEQRVPCVGYIANLVEDLLIFRIQAPVALIVVLFGVVLGQLQWASLTDWLLESQFSLIPVVLDICLRRNLLNIGRRREMAKAVDWVLSEKRLEVSFIYRVIIRGSIQDVVVHSAFVSFEESLLQVGDAFFFAHEAAIVLLLLESFSALELMQAHLWHVVVICSLEVLRAVPADQKACLVLRGLGDIADFLTVRIHHNCLALYSFSVVSHLMTSCVTLESEAGLVLIELHQGFVIEAGNILTSIALADQLVKGFRYGRFIGHWLLLISLLEAFLSNWLALGGC